MQARALVAFACATLAARESLALSPEKSLTQYGHRVWDSDAGLPQSSVQTILQSRDGYLWLGTQEGLARFDGARFVVRDGRNTPELRTGNVFRLLEDGDGDLWIGTGGGGLSVIGEGGVRTYTVADGLPNDMVHALHRDRSDVLWIATASGLCRRTGDRFEPVDGVVGVRVWTVLMDRAGTLWAGTDKGLARRSPDGAFEILPSAPVRALFEDRQGVLWIGSARGLERVVGSTVTLEGATHGAVLAISDDRDGSLWVGTETGLLRRRDGRFERFPASNPLAEERIWSLLEDREGNLWAGTLNRGLHQLRDLPVTPFGIPEGLPHDVAWSVLEDRRGAIWIGTGGGGLLRLEKGGIRAFTTRDGLPSDSVYSLLEDSSGALWAGTLGGGLARVRDGRVEDRSATLGPGGPVRTMYEGPDGALWFGRGAGGLVRWKDGRTTTYGRTAGLPNESAFALAGDSRDLWIGTFGGGLVRLRDEAFTTFGRNEGLTNEVVLSLHLAANGDLWIGTNGGGVFRLRGGVMRAVTAAHGLFDDVIFAMIPDENGERLWMSSNRGVFHVSMAELNGIADGTRTALASIAYGKNEGMRSHECNGGQHPAGWRSRDGRLWFPTTKGVAAIRTDARFDAGEIPVRIEGAVVDGRPLEPGAGWELASGTKHVEIAYTALAFRSPETIQFRYRMHGYDADWVDAGRRRVAYYSALPAGTHRFEVQASTKGVTWSSPSASVTVVRRPRLHETGLFYVFVAAILAAGTVGVHRIRVAHLYVRARELQSLVQERTTALAVEADRRKMQEQLIVSERMASVGVLAAGVAHEINNPLAALMANVEFISREIAQARQRQGAEAVGLSEIDEPLRDAREAAERIRFIVRDLKIFSRSTDEERSRAIDVHAILDSSLRMALNEIRQRARLVKEYASALPPVEGNDARLGQVFLNLIVNAAQAIPEGHLGENEIRITTRTEGGRVIVAVSDTGAGIPPEVLPRIFDPFFTTKAVGVGTGLGLAICHRIVSGLGGSMTVDSQVGQGTTVRVELSAAEERTPEPQPAVSAPVAAVARRGRILVVDDEKIVARVIERTLANDHDVTTLTNATDALATLESGERFDAILCDLMMPSMTGMDLHAKLTALAPEQAAKIVFVTGGAFTEGAREFLNRTKNPWLEKPFEPAKLRLLVESVLAKP